MRQLPRRLPVAISLIEVRLDAPHPSSPREKASLVSARSKCQRPAPKFFHQLRDTPRRRHCRPLECSESRRLRVSHTRALRFAPASVSTERISSRNLNRHCERREDFYGLPRSHRGLRFPCSDPLSQLHHVLRATERTHNPLLEMDPGVRREGNLRVHLLQRADGRMCSIEPWIAATAAVFKRSSTRVRQGHPLVRRYAGARTPESASLTPSR